VSEEEGHASAADTPQLDDKEEIPNDDLAKRRAFSGRRACGNAKRIFVYYALDRSGVPSKFVTKEIGLPASPEAQVFGEEHRHAGGRGPAWTVEIFSLQ
jgi:hypothetical protein